MTDHIIEIYDFRTRKTEFVLCELPTTKMDVPKLVTVAHAALIKQGRRENYKIERIFRLRSDFRLKKE